MVSNFIAPTNKPITFHTKIYDMFYKINIQKKGELANKNGIFQEIRFIPNED